MGKGIEMIAIEIKQRVQELIEIIQTSFFLFFHLFPLQFLLNVDQGNSSFTAVFSTQKKKVLSSKTEENCFKQTHCLVPDTCTDRGGILDVVTLAKVCAGRWRKHF